MDWANIIIAITGMLFTSGGVVTIVTLKDKKTEAFLNNVTTQMKHWENIANEREGRVGELKADLDKKDEKIEELYDELAEERSKNAELVLRNAKLEFAKCEVNGCLDRRPPRVFAEMGEIHKIERK